MFPVEVYRPFFLQRVVRALWVPILLNYALILILRCLVYD